VTKSTHNIIRSSVGCGGVFFQMSARQPSCFIRLKCVGNSNTVLRWVSQKYRRRVNDCCSNHCTSNYFILSCACVVPNSSTTVEIIVSSKFNYNSKHTWHI